MFERILIPFFATAMAIAMISTGLVFLDSPLSDAGKSDVTFAPAPWTQITPENPTGSYRFTKNGWEDSTYWRIGSEESKVKFIDNIHPLIWTLVVVLIAFGLAILASDEKNVKRLLAKSD